MVGDVQIQVTCSRIPLAVPIYAGFDASYVLHSVLRRPLAIIPGGRNRSGRTLGHHDRMPRVKQSSATAKNTIQQ